MTQVQPHNSSVSTTGSAGQPSGSGAREAAEPQRPDVLVVDDDPALLDVTSFVLESEGFGVRTAKNGEEALEVLRTRKPPGLVLLDLMMPVMNGWQFLEEIAKSPAFKEIPVVVLTAAGSMGVPGAVEVLRKPFDLGVLVETVERHARG